jgi:small subunit ribosomal protein S21
LSKLRCGRRDGEEMPRTVVRENETIEEALKRFKREVSRNGVLAEARKREHYLKPSDVKKMKKRAARRRRSH